MFPSQLNWHITNVSRHTSNNIVCFMYYTFFYSSKTVQIVINNQVTWIKYRWHGLETSLEIFVSLARGGLIVMIQIGLVCMFVFDLVQLDWLMHNLGIGVRNCKLLTKLCRIKNIGFKFILFIKFTFIIIHTRC